MGKSQLKIINRQPVSLKVSDLSYTNKLLIRLFNFKHTTLYLYNNVHYSYREKPNSLTSTIAY